MTDYSYRESEIPKDMKYCEFQERVEFKKEMI